MRLQGTVVETEEEKLVYQKILGDVNKGVM